MERFLAHVQTLPQRAPPPIPLPTAWPSSPAPTPVHPPSTLHHVLSPCVHPPHPPAHVDCSPCLSAFLGLMDKTGTKRVARGHVRRSCRGSGCCRAASTRGTRARGPSSTRTTSPSLRDSPPRTASARRTRSVGTSSLQRPLTPCSRRGTSGFGGAAAHSRRKRCEGHVTTAPSYSLCQPSVSTLRAGGASPWQPGMEPGKLGIYIDRTHMYIILYNSAV